VIAIAVYIISMLLGIGLMLPDIGSQGTLLASLINTQNPIEGNH